MKQPYETPALTVCRFETTDVILASGDDNDNTGTYPWEEVAP